MATKIEGKELNGYKIRSWGDLIAVATILAMLLSCVLWGLKLEGEVNELRTGYGNRLAAIEARVADGILPRAEERIRAQGLRIDKLEQHDHEHQK